MQEEEPVLEKVEEKKEEVKVEEEKLDNSAYARMRREKAAAEKRAQELEARLQALESAKVQDSPAQMQEEVRAFEPDPVTIGRCVRSEWVVVTGSNCWAPRLR